jgi:hypothetical protein
LGDKFLFSAYIGSGTTDNDYFGLRFVSSDQLRVGGYSTIYRLSTAVFRDVSAWYHIVCAVDTTQGTATNRIKLWVNGSQITTFSTENNPTQNTDLGINQAAGHTIGREAGFASYQDGYLADIHFIDGQALTPSSFTETNATTGQLIPKAYSGSYGSNGWKLSFSDNSTAAALGTDSSSNGNSWTVNNLTAGPAFTSNSWSGYFDGTGDYLSLSSAFTLGTGNFTVEAWIKTSTASQKAEIWQNGSSLGSFVVSTNFNAGNAGTIFGATTPPGSGWSVLFASTSTLAANTWNHVAWVRSSGVITVYINGAASGTLSNSANSLSLSRIGAWPDPDYDLQGYISNLRVVVGSAVYTSGFTVPTTPLTAITNTSLLTLQNSTFVDNSLNAYSITSSGDTRVSYESPFEEPVDTDSLVDTPTSYGTDTGVGNEVRGNHCTLNPLAKASTHSLTDGNLKITGTGTGAYGSTFGTIGMSSGKWYWEQTLVSINASDIQLGLGNKDTLLGNFPGATSRSYGFSSNSLKWNSSGSSAYTTAWVNGDVIGLAFDAGAGSLTLYRNGVSLGVAFSGIPADTYFPIAGAYTSSNSSYLNFGQRAFAYTAPSGFKALCDTNLPAPTISKPSTVMDVKLYTGNGSSQTISGLGFSPDLVWTKSRSASDRHNVFDILRSGLRLRTDGTEAEDSTTVALTSNGFSLGSQSENNSNGQSYAAWTWDAGASTVTNTSGSISAQVRANASAGFSVVTWTGNGTQGATIGHGLGVTPRFLIFKRRDDGAGASAWWTYHASVTSPNANWWRNYGTLNGTAAFADWGGDSGLAAAPSSTLLTVGNYSGFNANGGTYVAYCFAPVAGYSSFGSYVGNGSSDGPMVWTGFRPKYLLWKSSGSGQWFIHDTSRSPYNFSDLELAAETAGAEYSANGAGAGQRLDFLSNGFKVRTSNIANNSNGVTYIYAAFAESPFQYARAR